MVDWKGVERTKWLTPGKIGVVAMTCLLKNNKEQTEELFAKLSVLELGAYRGNRRRSEEHTSELQSQR